MTPPRVVQEVSWVNNFWPEDFPGDQVQFERPLVQRYCLMGVKDSYTDFHVDFGGTSVWYHVLRVRVLLLCDFQCKGAFDSCALVCSLVVVASVVDCAIDPCRSTGTLAPTSKYLN